MPVSFIVKRQRWKTLCLLKHEGKREFRRFSRAYAAPACSDQVQMESLLTFFVHQIEKGFSFDTYQYGRGRGALRNIADLSARLIEADAQWRDKSIYKGHGACFGRVLPTPCGSQSRYRICDRIV